MPARFGAHDDYENGKLWANFRFNIQVEYLGHLNDFPGVNSAAIQIEENSAPSHKSFQYFTKKLDPYQQKLTQIPLMTN